MNIEWERLWKYSEYDEGRYSNDICLVATVQIVKAYGVVDVYLHLFVTLVRDGCVCGQLYALVTLPLVTELQGNHENP